MYPGRWFLFRFFPQSLPGQHNCICYLHVSSSIGKPNHTSSIVPYLFSVIHVYPSSTVRAWKRLQRYTPKFDWRYYGFYSVHRRISIDFGTDIRPNVSLCCSLMISWKSNDRCPSILRAREWDGLANLKHKCPPPEGMICSVRCVTRCDNRPSCHSEKPFPRKTKNRVYFIVAHMRLPATACTRSNSVDTRMRS